MKRVIQRKAKQSGYGELPNTGDSLQKQKRASQDIGNKTRTSAAMLGLALSMGASGSILSCHGKGAIAAESKIPVGVSSLGDGSLDSVAEGSHGLVTPEGEANAHIIREGETLWTLSQLYGISDEDLLRVNSLEPGVVLQVGQTVLLPSGHHVETESKVLTKPTSGSESHTASAEEASLDSGNLAHLQVNEIEAVVAVASDTSSMPMVTPSETEGHVVSDTLKTEKEHAPAVKNEVVLESETPAVQPVSKVEPETSSVSISSEPDESEQLIAQADQVAFMGVEDTSQPGVDAPLSAPTTHRIAVGETLAVIARRYSISASQLAEVNRIRNPNRIFAGQVLNLPPDASLVTSTEVFSPVPEIPEPVEVAVLPESSDVKVEVSLPIVSENVAEVLPGPEASEVASVQSVDSTFYVERLLGEIEQLSEGYREAESSQAVIIIDSPDATAEPIAEPTDVVAYSPVTESSTEPSTEPLSTVQDPVFVLPTEVDDRVESELDSSNDGSAREVAPDEQAVVSPDAKPNASPNAELIEPEPDLVAAAPLGAENYIPLNEPVTGRMVSPDLPPLMGPENYLPNGSSSFNGYTYPAQGTLTSGYGWRWGRMHRGIDVAAPIGTPIVASAPGVVEYSGWNSGGYGNMVEIRHPDGSMTRYAHNSRNLVRVGQQVTQGEQIAEMGSTGYSTGPHVHFEIHLPERGTVNPVAYLSN